MFAGLCRPFCRKPSLHLQGCFPAWHKPPGEPSRGLGLNHAQGIRKGNHAPAPGRAKGLNLIKQGVKKWRFLTSYATGRFARFLGGFRCLHKCLFSGALRGFHFDNII
jgi:hypothetical protein